VNYYIFVNTQE